MTQPKPKPHTQSPLQASARFPAKRLPAFHSQQPYCDFLHDPTPNSKLNTIPYKKLANFEITLLRYPIYLCKNCLIAWRKTWDEALEDSARTSHNFHSLISHYLNDEKPNEPTNELSNT